ncbi:metal-dependent hydrolase [Paenibacillus gorillae]|uniref:metal-dependent hydrolase n=1 Tax=Paenibacillus gorillae TaxID=1243662 RepID=UPI0005A61C7E|nr:metal-dependent hydrolase [Paenibacillus gorillae]
MELIIHTLIHAAAGASIAYLIGKPDNFKLRILLLTFGAIAGLSPDFTKYFGDIFFHSVLLAPIAGLLFSFVFTKVQHSISFMLGWIVFTLSVGTHLLIDYIGNGVALFYPLAQYEYEFSVIDRDDLLVLIPLAAAVSISLFFRKGRGVVMACVIITCLYLASLTIFKIELEQALERRYHADHVTLLLTYPDPLKREWKFMLRTDKAAVFGRSSIMGTNIRVEDESVK